MDRVPYNKRICKRILQYSLIFGAVPLMEGCGTRDFGFALPSKGETFVQNGDENSGKVDIIWMVDGSNTMANHQTNLANNFGSFISEFASKNFDYRMVVASTDSWVRELEYDLGPNSSCINHRNTSKNPNALYYSSADCETTLASWQDLAAFRDGDIYGDKAGVSGGRSGVFMLGSDRPVSEVKTLFATNVRTGTRGDGSRESAFQSLRAVLRRDENGQPAYGSETHTVLSGFRRPDAFLAVIIVSDEEDQGRRANGTEYASTAEYVGAFKTFMSGYAGNGDYSVSSIVVDDIDNCDYQLSNQATESVRYPELARKTGGVYGNICAANFGDKLQEIAQKVVALLTRFKLQKEPDVSTIRVEVNGVEIPQSDVNGWTYGSDAGKYFLTFHGSAIPPQGARINVDYVPATAN